MTPAPPCVRTLLALLLALAPASTALAAEVTGPPLRAGFARVDITPAQPVTMSGYENRTGLSRGVHDPLSARVVVFESQGHRLALVSTDVIGFYGDTADAFRRAILEAHDLEPSEPFLTAIHTHAAPRVTLDRATAHLHNLAYTEELKRKLVAAVGAALADLQPARLGTASGSSPVGVNRREVFYDEAGRARVWIGRNPQGVHNSEVQVVKVVAEGRRGAVLWRYATHSTSLGWENYQISGDVHGLAEQFVEGQMGDGFIAPAFVGASGDIDPWFRVLPGFETASGWIPEPVLLGTLLGEEVVHVTRGIEVRPGAGPVRSAFETLRLPGKPPDDPEVDGAVPPVPLHVTVARVGDIALVGVGAEVLTDVGLALERGSPFPTTLVITHCNGATGYLPQGELFVEGGYEVESSPFAATAADQLVRGVARMLHDLRDGQP